MATIARQENIRRSERIVAGLQRAKRKGSQLGRPQVSSAKASRTTLWRRAKGAAFEYVFRELDVQIEDAKVYLEAIGAMRPKKP